MGGKGGVRAATLAREQGYPVRGGVENAGARGPTAQRQAAAPRATAPRQARAAPHAPDGAAATAC